jgi:hypothetical protein
MEKQMHLKTAEIHYHRIQEALKHLSPLFPVDEHTVQHFTENETLWLELLMHCFAKLQDLMGSQLINLFLLHTEEAINVDAITMRDKLNKLEKLSVIENADLWISFRDIRNHTAHEYPDDPEIAAQHLNTLYRMTDKLLECYLRLKTQLMNEY